MLASKPTGPREPTDTELGGWSLLALGLVVLLFVGGALGWL